VRTQISVTGFTPREIESGLQDLLAELAMRPWLLNAHARWDAERQRLVIVIERECESTAIGGATEATLDEVWDCVIACFNFSSEGIHFDVDSSVLV
jgi:hypothetical protein